MFLILGNCIKECFIEPLFKKFVDGTSNDSYDIFKIYEKFVTYYLLF